MYVRAHSAQFSWNIYVLAASLRRVAFFLFVFFIVLHSTPVAVWMFFFIFVLLLLLLFFFVCFSLVFRMIKTEHCMHYKKDSQLVLFSCFESTARCTARWSSLWYYCCVYLPFLFKIMIFWRISFHFIPFLDVFFSINFYDLMNLFTLTHLARARANNSHTFKFEYGCCAICLAVNLANYDVQMVKLNFEINTFSMLTLIAFFFFNSIVWLILDFFSITWLMQRYFRATGTLKTPVLTNLLTCALISIDRNWKWIGPIYAPIHYDIVIYSALCAFCYRYRFDFLLLLFEFCAEKRRRAVSNE